MGLGQSVKPVTGTELTEEQYNLIRASFRGKKNAHNRTLGEIAMSKWGKASHKAIMQALLSVALSGDADFEMFLMRCARYGVGVRGNIGGDHVSGISFEVGGKVFKGSKIGYSWKTISEMTSFD